MPRPLTVAGLALAALLALTACSTPAEEAHASQTYSSEELSGFLGEVTDADGEGLRVIPTADLAEGMAQSKAFLEGVTITPEECSVYVSNSFDVPEDAGYATGVSGAEGDAVQTLVSVASSDDTAFTEERFSAITEALDACATFTLTTQGFEVTQTVESLEAGTDAQETYGTVTRQTSVNGGEQQTMTVIGSSGYLSVTAVRTATGEVPEGTQGQLEELVDSTLAAVG